MKKTLLLIAAFVTFAAGANAKPVDAGMARRVATHFWNDHRPSKASPVGTLTELAFPGLGRMHIFDVDGTGFVIVAADDCVRPVLAYSFDDPFPAELNPEVGYWLGIYNAQIDDAVRLGHKPSSAVTAQWESLLPGQDVADSPKDITAVPAMLHVRWNQSEPYNQYCPYDSNHNARTVVGCVATAMAQIMKYWNYPCYGAGSRTYSYRDFHNISADFSQATYLWQFMPNMLDMASADYERDAVATLSFHCGVAVEMMYGVSAIGGSGAYSSCGYWTNACATSAFVDHFKYDSTLFHADRYSHTDAEWMALIDTNLALGQPMYYSGRDSTGGHAFVLDGSDLEGRYHFNWGWGGYGNGFYTLDSLAPGRNNGAGGNATYTFNFDQGAIFGIRPGEVEQFDTVDYRDSICDGTRYVYFRDYKLRVANVAGVDTLLRHIDTIFRYHLNVIGMKRVVYDLQIPNVEMDIRTYCPATGVTLPECTRSKTNCLFLGWSRSATADSAIHQPGETLHYNSNIAFFAIWLDTTYVPDDTTHVPDDTLGIDELSILNSQFSIHPNPTTGDINVSLPARTADLSVVDALGRTVLRKDHASFAGGTARISLATLPKGVYTVRAKVDGMVYNQRIIKQ